MTKDDLLAYLDEDKLSKEELKQIISELLLTSLKEWYKTDDKFYSGEINAYSNCFCLLGKVIFENESN